MKISELYESTMTRADIITWISRNIEIHGDDFTIHPDNSVDFRCDVDLHDLNIRKQLPFKIGKVIGDFDISGNHIDSLINCPTEVTGSFDCSATMITSFKDAPMKKIGTQLIIPDGQILSNVLQLLTIEGLTDRIFGEDSTTWVDIVNRHLYTQDFFTCQQQLIDAGYEDLAQL